MHKLAGTLLVALAGMAGIGETRGHSASPKSPAAANAAQTSAPAADCSAEARALPRGASRVYIALRNGKDGSGSSMADARDGSTVTAFDTVLRCYSEGCANPTNPKKSVAKTENLIVCLGAGTFSTLGSYDFI